MVIGCRLMGFRELWKVPTEPHLVEVAQVILACLNCFKDFVALYVVQWYTQRIRIFHFLARFCMVTGHLVPFIPLLEALADLLVPPCAEVYIKVMSKNAAVGFPFFLGVFAVKLWQQSVGVSFSSFPVWLGLLCLFL